MSQLPPAPQTWSRKLYAHYALSDNRFGGVGHGGFTMMFNHYRERVKSAEGIAFWNIRLDR